MTVIGCIVPEIWRATDIISCHFGPFFALLPNPLTTQKINILKKWKKHLETLHFTHVYHQWQSYDVWFLRYQAWQMEFFVILDRFLPFYLSNNTKNRNFEKLKKTPGEIIILHKYAKNHDHILYCYFDMVRNGCHFYFLFWAIFCPFTSLTAWKIKI